MLIYFSRSNRKCWKNAIWRSKGIIIRMHFKLSDILMTRANLVYISMGFVSSFIMFRYFVSKASTERYRFEKISKFSKWLKKIQNYQKMLVKKKFIQNLFFLNFLKNLKVYKNFKLQYGKFHRWPKATTSCSINLWIRLMKTRNHGQNKQA